MADKSSTPAWDAVRREQDEAETVQVGHGATAGESERQFTRVTITDVSDPRPPQYKVLDHPSAEDTMTRDKAARLAPVIKFNNTGSYADCLVCGGVTDLEVGAEIFNEGSYDWICDNCLEDLPESEMRVWRNRIQGWPDDTRIEPIYNYAPETPF